MKHIISVNNGEDYIRLTGMGKTWVYSDWKNATRFDNKRKANAFIKIMPKGLILNSVPA